MKKIEKSRVFLEEKMSLFQCPVCSESYQSVTGNGVRCPNNHQFDLSKKGTLHFLLKASHNDYDRDMLSQRKSLAETGFFHPMLAEIIKVLKDKKNDTILDVGCGEGSHLHYLTEHGLTGTKVGFDISKDAIQLAAANFFEDAFWCVADLAQSPFSKEQFDVILNIFSPSHYQEFDRIMKPKGTLVKVVPNAAYLQELRQKLYWDDDGKRIYDNNQVIDRFAEAYPDFTQQDVTYEVALTKESYQWLLAMTPLTWSASDEQIKQALEEPLKSITVSVTLLIGQKND